MRSIGRCFPKRAQPVMLLHPPHRQSVLLCLTLRLPCPEHAPPPLAQALFPAIATYFKFTEEEVTRLARKQEEHASLA